ncbi:MAG: crossover junction endodeoxyribonuclease RuvC [Deltaproteobacteria bacterium]|nr:crossover junction endodeoxyribonuclease RuvC [Deltaproteobacteria bacterium]
MRVLGIDPGTIVTGYGVVDGERGKLIYVCDGGIAPHPLGTDLKSVPTTQGSKGQVKILENEPSNPRTLEPSRSSVLARRLAIIFDSLHQLVRDCRPDVVAVEGIFHSRNPRSAIMLGHARGVVLLCATRAGLEVFEYSPMEVKKAVVGYGRATKDQVQRMVKTLLKMPTLPGPDASDALAVAICHIHHKGR